MSRSASLVVGIVVLVAVVLFVASLVAYDSAQFSVRGPSGDEAVLSFRYSERGGEQGLLTGLAIEINQFFGDFGWYRDLSRAWSELGEPLRILLNWMLGGFWALAFLGRRR
jgi:hypothetical protein